MCARRLLLFTVMAVFWPSLFFASPTRALAYRFGSLQLGLAPGDESFVDKVMEHADPARFLDVYRAVFFLCHRTDSELHPGLGLPVAKAKQWADAMTRGLYYSEWHDLFVGEFDKLRQGGLTSKSAWETWKMGYASLRADAVRDHTYFPRLATAVDKELARFDDTIDPRTRLILIFEALSFAHSRSPGVTEFRIKEALEVWGTFPDISPLLAFRIFTANNLQDLDVYRILARFHKIQARVRDGVAGRDLPAESFEIFVLGFLNAVIHPNLWRGKNSALLFEGVDAYVAQDGTFRDWLDHRAPLAKGFLCRRNAILLALGGSATGGYGFYGLLSYLRKP